MLTMTPQQYVLVGAFFLIVFVIAKSLLKSNKSQRSKINLEDLLIGEDGRTSKAAAVMLGAFAMTTWMMIYLTLSSRITEGYFGLYMTAWVAPTVTNLIVNAGVKKAQAKADNPEPAPSITQNLTVKEP